MNKRTLILPLIASLALAACSNESHTLVQNGPEDPMGDALKNAAPVELPPAITVSKSYRCKDSSVIHLDWLADNKGANIRATKEGIPTQLKPGADGKPPFTAEGYSLTGSAESATITLTRPDKGSQSCKG
jgi:hypothetical protein